MQKPSNPTVLIVDDNEINRQVAEHMFSMFGFDVSNAEDGSQAIRMLSVKEYDLIIMDCRMPIMDGYDATREIRNSNSKVLNHDIPVIAMTANVMLGDRQKCLDSGMDDYMAKPISMDMIKAVIDKWLPQSKNSNKTIKEKSKAKVAKDNFEFNKIKDISIFDYSEIFNRLGGDIVMVKKITQGFINSIEEHITNIKSSFEFEDYELTSASAHRLKGSAATIGCKQMCYLAYEIEKASKYIELDRVETLIALLEKSYKVTQVAVNKKLLTI